MPVEFKYCLACASEAARLKQDNARLIEETHNWSAAVKKLEAERATRWLPLNAEGSNGRREGELVLLALNDGRVVIHRYEYYRMRPYWGFWNGAQPTHYQPMPAAPSSDHRNKTAG